MDTFKGAYPPEAISPVALGLISDPPTIVLAYDLQKPSRFGEKMMCHRRKRKMPLRDFTDKSNVKRYAFNLRQRHGKYLVNVVDVTLEKMLRMVQEIQKGKDLGASLALVNKEYSIDPNEDLNILAPAQLAQRKALMEETFRKNLLRPEDPGYVYDKVVDFEDVGTSKAPGNDWDEDEEDGESSRDKKEENYVKSMQLQISESKNPEEMPSSPFDKPKEERQPEPQHGPIDFLQNTNVEEDEAPQGSQPQPPNPDNLPIPPALAALASVSTPKSDLLTPAPGSYPEDCSTSPDIEEVLENIDIETGVLDEEDEDFWQ